MTTPAPIINSITVPSSIVTRGEWIFFEQKRVTMADGTITAVGPQGAIWRFPHLTKDELTWWLINVLGGANSLSAAMSLWRNDRRESLIAFTSGTVYRPDFSESRSDGNVARFQYNRYWDVTVRFNLLLPVVTSGPWTVGSSAVGGGDMLVYA